jgi:peptidoglycan hydrolase-like protein with peptidoglycan-binding domain
VQRRCHDGYRKVGTSWVKSICRWNTKCECLTSVSWPATRRGNTGPNVYAVQHLLTARGFPTTIDGIFGAGTETSVNQFQAANGITANGVVDARTWPTLVITVRMPDTGHAVHGAQRQLNKYAYGLIADGAFGPLTDAAVRDFQRQNGLSDDGVVGPMTWRTLTGGKV